MSCICDSLIGSRCSFCFIEIEADHIKPWAYYPDLRYELDNGRTLCLKCHRKTYKEVFTHRKKVA